MAAKGEPSKVVLAAAVVRVMVTALTWRDLRSRSAGVVDTDSGRVRADQIGRLP